MKRKHRLSTALDIDDLLMECTSYAIKLANEKYKFDPPISLHEVNSWGKTGRRTDVIFEYFSKSKNKIKKTILFIAKQIPEFFGEYP